MSVELVPFAEDHLPGVLRLYDAEGWPSFLEDVPLARRAVTAPGVVAMVAVDGSEVVGFARVLSDGALSAYLCELVVAETARRRGVGRALVAESFARSGARRLDLLAEEDSEEFYRSFSTRAFPGYRIYPAD
jgi:ribosomal protein S18 acetylase RimI-like enzyme